MVNTAVDSPSRAHARPASIPACPAPITATSNAPASNAINSFRARIGGAFFVICESPLVLPLGELSPQATERGRVLTFELLHVCSTQRLPLVTKGSCRRRRLKGSERCRFAERPPAEVRQNVHLLIPSGFASLPWSPREALDMQNPHPLRLQGWGFLHYSASSLAGLFLLYATTMRRFGSVPVENVVTSG